MPRKYTFETTTVDGIEYVIANPVNETDEMVRMEAEWTEGDDVEGEWERAVSAIIEGDLLGDMDLEDGNGRIDRQTAVETLAAAEDDQGPVVSSERQADALIEYFVEEDILQLEGNQVVLLQDPRNENISGRASLNWAAGIEACIDKIEETKDRVQRAKDKLESKMDDLDTGSNRIEERIQETGQKLRSLGDGPGVPDDPSELDESEQKRFEQLKRQFIHHKKMRDVDNENLLETVEEGTTKLAHQMEMLESAKEALSTKEEEIRIRAVQQREFPQDATNIVDNMGQLATKLAGVGGVEEAVENTSDEELASMVENEFQAEFEDMQEVEEMATEGEAQTESTSFNTGR
jgi:hypothetical protein